MREVTGVKAVDDGRMQLTRVSWEDEVGVKGEI